MSKLTLSQKVEVQAALQALERGLVQTQGARALLLSLLQADEGVPAAQLPAAPVQPSEPAPAAVPAAAPAAPPNPAPPAPAAAPAPASPFSAKPPGKANGGYIHPRTRKAMFAEGTSLGVPEAVLKHYRLLKDAIKPTAEGYQNTEDLLAKVKAARAAGQDPAPLWASYLPKSPA